MMEGPDFDVPGPNRFRVDERVYVNYKGKKKSCRGFNFFGKIIKCHGNETYDIMYDADTTEQPEVEKDVSWKRISSEWAALFCSMCNSGDDEANMLLCGDGKGKGCNNCIHLRWAHVLLCHVVTNGVVLIEYVLDAWIRL